LNDSGQTRLTQRLHAIAYCPDAGKNHAIRLQNHGGIRNNLHIHIGGGVLQGFCNRMQITHSVINNSNRRHKSSG
jgi:hypothetical protein